MLLKLALPTVVLAFAIAYLEWDRHNGICRPLAVAELEAHLRNEFTLSEIKLTQLPGGRIEGGGVGVTGRSYQFDILQSEVSRTVVAKWERTNPPQKGESNNSINFRDHSHLYLLLFFVYLICVGKVLRNYSRPVVQVRR